MPKYPLIFLLLLLTINYAHALELELTKQVFTPNDKLVIFGTAIPNDSLIIELFNPTGNLIYRTQLDIGPNGEFASILLTWPEPDEDRFRVGTYTLTVTSSISRDSSISKAFVYQLQEKQTKDTSIPIEKRLNLDLSMPSTANIDKDIPIIAYVSLNDSPLIGLESIEANIRYPDNRVLTINNFTSIGDGLYETRFTSNITGYHTIILNAKHQELSVNKASIIDIVRTNQNNQLQELATKIDSLDIKIANDTNNIINNVNNIKESINNMTSAIGQLTSLLLPIVGMIAIIVALQATILAKRK